MSYFFIGIKGAAMSNMAVMLKEMGNTVAGCDVREEFITEPVLKDNGIPVLVGFDPSIFPSGVGTVVYSAAHQGEMNPIVTFAKKAGIRVVSQAVLLGELMDGFNTGLAVSGCHGKTTTTSLLAFALSKLHADPSYMVGVPYFNGNAGGHFGGRKFMVIEADEYGVNPPRDKTPKFLHLRPNHILCTNIDYDHPDVYGDLEETKKAFLTFFGKRKLYLCLDDPNLRSLMPRLEKKNVKTYGFSAGADMVVTQANFTEQETSFSLTYRGKSLGTFSVRLFGEKSILNAAGVILLLTDLGFTADDIRNVIHEFSSVKRRFEQIYDNGAISLYDDYGHHPNEISATISAARKRFPKRRLLIIFQPHTYSRTFSLKNEFVKSLAEADMAFVTPIFASAREKKEEFHVSSADLQTIAKEKNIKTVRAFDSTAALLTDLKKAITKGDVVFTVGAGDVYKLKDDIIDIISSNAK